MPNLTFLPPRRDMDNYYNIELLAQGKMREQSVKKQEVNFNVLYW